MKTLAITITVILLVSTFAWGQGSKSSSLAEVVTYTGADREQILVQGAKKEGKVTWYTSLSGEYKDLVKGFEGKYPGITVEVYRSDSREVGTRLLQEGQAGRHIADVTESTLGPLMLLRDKGLLAPYTSPHISRYAESARENAGKGLYFWIADRELYMGLGYNKNLIPPSSIPKRFQDLLKPELKGQIAFVTSTSGARAMGAILKTMGEDFVNKLSNQDIKLFAMSGTAMTDQVVSGAVGVSPTVFRYIALPLAAKGAPIGWVPMDLVPTNVGGAAILRNAPHPYGAALLVDFLLSTEGQEIMQARGMGSPAKDPGLNRWVPEKGLTAAQYTKMETNWQKLLLRIGRTNR